MKMVMLTGSPRKMGNSFKLADRSNEKLEAFGGEVHYHRHPNFQCETFKAKEFSA